MCFVAKSRILAHYENLSQVRFREGLQDSPSSGCYDSLQIICTVQHDDCEDERRYKADGDRTHQRPRYNYGSVLALFCQMYGSVNTSVHVVRIDQACQKGDTVDPAALVQKCVPYCLYRLEMRAGTSKTTGNDRYEASYRDKDYEVSEDMFARSGVYLQPTSWIHIVRFRM
jgi:hypothetical protein